MKIKLHIITFTILSILFYNCNNNDDQGIIDTTDDYTEVPTTPVVIDLNSVPYAKLSDYHLFEGNIKDMKPSLGVHPYNLASQLFTDYASKKRFVWMPTGTKAEFVDSDEILKFPTGTVLVKSFYYTQALPSNNQKILETRIMIKKGTLPSGEEDWLFANYIWNEEQTEATLFMNGTDVEVSFVNEYDNQYTTNYRIPSETECLICHKNSEKAIPIGPKPYNMNINFAYANGNQNQLDYWINNQLIDSSFNRNFTQVVNWKNPEFPLSERVRSYIEINCAHCHAETKHCDYRPIRLGYLETTIDENLGICVTPQDNFDPSYSSIITPQNIGRSVMHYRLNTTEESYRMPLLGRTLVDEEAVQLLEDYINSLATPCQ